MGYANIDNLYKNQDVLLFKEVYALEKIHGTSAHVAWKDGAIRFFAGGCSHDLFVSLFDKDALFEKFNTLGHPEVIVFGEQYGGKQQGMSKKYGKQARLIAFDGRIGDNWLATPDALDVAIKLGIDFVHFVKVPATVAALDAERDAPSIQAKRNGILDDQPREGIVIRPPIEVRTNNGERIVAKHKRAEERETRTQREVGLDTPVILTEAEAIAT